MNKKTFNNLVDFYDFLKVEAEISYKTQYKTNPDRDSYLGHIVRDNTFVCHFLYTWNPGEWNNSIHINSITLNKDEIIEKYNKHIAYTKLTEKQPKYITYIQENVNKLEINDIQPQILRKEDK